MHVTPYCMDASKLYACDPLHMTMYIATVCLNVTNKVG